ncbi:hypothetical protein ACFL5S_00805 [Fibrobacterota bacterium]
MNSDLNSNHHPSINDIEESKGSILIIGDWFIDENWLMSRYDSYTSSNVGKVHYKSRLSNTNTQILSLCGGANVFSMLQNTLKEKFNFFGRGAWNPKDNEIIKCIMCPMNIEAFTKVNPFLLRGFEHIHPSEK